MVSVKLFMISLHSYGIHVVKQGPRITASVKFVYDLTASRRQLGNIV